MKWLGSSAACSTAALKETQVAAEALGLTLQPLAVPRADEVELVFAAMRKERAGALIVLSDPFFITQRTRLANLAAKHSLPAMFPWREHVEAGGLMGYGASIPDLFRRAATYVDAILRGAKPADLPVEQPTKFEFVINLKTATVLGLTIPPSVLARADAIIE